MTQRAFKDAFMTIVPFSANHVTIKGRGETYVDITTDVAASDQIFLLTKSGIYTIDNNGNISKTH